MFHFCIVYEIWIYVNITYINIHYNVYIYKKNFCNLIQLILFVGLVLFMFSAHSTSSFCVQITTFVRISKISLQHSSFFYIMLSSREWFLINGIEKRPLIKFFFKYPHKINQKPLFHCVIVKDISKNPRKNTVRATGLLVFRRPFTQS